MQTDLFNEERINAKRKVRDIILAGEREQYQDRNLQYAQMNNDTAFQLTGNLLSLTGFDPAEREIARELFERSLYYQLHNGGFNW